MSLKRSGRRSRKNCFGVLEALGFTTGCDKCIRPVAEKPTKCSFIFGFTLLKRAEGCRVKGLSTIDCFGGSQTIRQRAEADRAPGKKE